MSPSKFDILHQVMDDKGYTFHTSGIYHLNLIAVRSSASDPNEYDDHLHVIYRGEDNRFKQHTYDINTCPGKHWFFNPWNFSSVEVLIPGQYKKFYRLSYDGYLFLKQRTHGLFIEDTDYSMTIKQNWTLNEKRNALKINPGADMICAHSLKKALGINYYNTGKQVLKNYKALDVVTELCERQIAAGWGLEFNYTLLEQKDFD